MCGIAGFIDFTHGTAREALADLARRMASALTHRGPDDEGIWVDEQTGVALAHRRLAILDLTSEGHQPKSSANGRYLVSFNGELYNHVDLRHELESGGHVFRGRSDTEVLLAAVQRWGIAGALPRFNGMFAFALWDRESRVLHLCRDRLGEKPLYYGRFGSRLLFGSELTALRAHPAFEARISRAAVALYMRQNHVPAPLCIYEDVRKLPAGCRLSVNACGGALPEPLPYWSLDQAFEAGLRERFHGSDDDAIARLDALLRSAVALRMEADVPLGAFLSGGIDSSAVVALMQAQCARRVQTFTIGFADPRFDEAPAAKAIARHLGTEHTELYVTPEDALAVIPSLPRIYDEPFADSSQIPTFLVSRLARSAVTVSLSGDGGDETFAGYGRYTLARRLWHLLRWAPAPARRALTAAIRRVDELDILDLPARPAKLLHRLGAVLPSTGPETLYREMVFSHWQVPGRGVAVDTDPAALAVGFARGPRGGSLLERMLLWDLLAYLPDDILVKVDRAAMHVSLESRMPLLDHRVTEFAFTLPATMKERRGIHKWILRQVLRRYMPPTLFERPKRGFHMPIDEWLRGPLRFWAQDLLAQETLARQGYLDASAVATHLGEHLAGKRAWGANLWVALMFQAWLNQALSTSEPSLEPAAATPA